MEVDDGGHAFMAACIDDVHGSHIPNCISLLLKSFSDTVILGFQGPA
jgi:hypothetical protein